MIPAFAFATMRRSGSHFCMHRALSSIVLNGPLEFGLHINSLGWGKMRTKAAARDPFRVIAYRKQNHFYTDEARPAPRSGSSDPVYMDAAYAWMTGQEKSFELNPSGLRLKFIAINIEDEKIASVAEKARSVFSGIPNVTAGCPVFVTLRALRSIALSRKKWLEQKGDTNIMASGFRKLDVEVWADHYRSSVNGDVVPMHYAEGVKSHGESIVREFRAWAPEFVSIRDRVPAWIADSVLSDGHGSSFVGSGASRGPEVERSLESRASRLSEFDYLFDNCPEAKEHAERFGEL